jgi:hypothetical protein
MYKYIFINAIERPLLNQWLIVDAYGGLGENLDRVPINVIVDAIL